MSSKQYTAINCIGITNRVTKAGKDKYVVFLDYDNKTFNQVSFDIQKLSLKYDLHWLYIFDSHGDKKHFHVLCPQIVDAYTLLAILWDSCCDMNYKKQFFTLKERTLRISEKPDRTNKTPKLIKIFRAKDDFDDLNYYSQAHVDFIKQYFTDKVPSNKFFIKSKIQFVKYITPV